MGEKSGGMTNMILIIIALVALIFIVNTSFPDFATAITNKMQNILETDANVEIPPKP